MGNSYSNENAYTLGLNNPKTQTITPKLSLYTTNMLTSSEYDISNFKLIKLNDTQTDSYQQNLIGGYNKTINNNDTDNLSIFSNNYDINKILIDKQKLEMYGGKPTKKSGLNKVLNELNGNELTITDNMFLDNILNKYNKTANHLSMIGGKKPTKKTSKKKTSNKPSNKQTRRESKNSKKNNTYKEVKTSTTSMQHGGLSSISSIRSSEFYKMMAELSDNNRNVSSYLKTNSSNSYIGGKNSSYDNPTNYSDEEDDYNMFNKKQSESTPSLRSDSSSSTLTTSNTSTHNKSASERVKNAVDSFFEKINI